ncbi:MAG: hypothetical protein IPH16_08990 [Haliscomenobacter sp.]|nr:hypothetical protein [Haliscomenobacter sp.]
MGIPLIFLFERFISQAFELEGFSTGVDQEVSADYLYASSIIVHPFIKKITVQTIPCPSAKSPKADPRWDRFLFEGAREEGLHW